MSHNRRVATVLLSFLILSLFSFTAASAAPQFANPQFKNIWEYSDKRVDEIPGAGRGYTWGPNSFGIFTEDYIEGLNGKRQVQYFDKSRMEISTNGRFVTNGLLTKELVNGSRQDGDAKFTQLAPSTVAVAGDDNSGGGNAIAPVYSSFKAVVTFNPGENTAPNRVNQIINQIINKAGEVKPLDNPPAQVVIGSYEPLLGHNIPQVFLDFQNQNGLVWNGGNYIPAKVYTDNPTSNVFGYAIAEAFWAKAVVAGLEKDVLIQLYERRVLTYTPSNPAEFRVEMGNIGQHYYQWRYSQNGGTGGNPNPTAAPTSTPIPSTTSVVPTSTPIPTPTSVPVNIPAVNCLAAINSSVNQAQACVNNSSPSKNSNVTVYGRLVVGGQVIKNVAMDTTWEYKTTTSYCSGNSGSSGVASCTRSIGNASSGYRVYITIHFSYGGQSYSDVTSFVTQ